MEFLNGVEKVLNSIDGIVWGPPLLILLVGTGIYFTFKLKLIQVFKLPLALKYYLLKMMKKVMKRQKVMYQVLRHYVLLYQLQ